MALPFFFREGGGNAGYGRGLSPAEARVSIRGWHYGGRQRGVQLVSKAHRGQQVTGPIASISCWTGWMARMKSRGVGGRRGARLAEDAEAKASCSRPMRPPFRSNSCGCHGDPSANPTPNTHVHATPHPCNSSPTSARGA